MLQHGGRGLENISHCNTKILPLAAFPGKNSPFYLLFNGVLIRDERSKGTAEVLLKIHYVRWKFNQN